jgi:hypothetical protein
MQNDIDSDEQSIGNLECSWIEDFDNLDNIYKNYYNENMDFINIKYIYLNLQKEITFVKKEKIFFKTSSVLSKEELLGILKNHSFLNDKKYSLFSILNFNINIQPMNLKYFLKNSNTNSVCPFLHSIKNIDSIFFEKSISLFHDINNLIIIFYEKDRVKNKMESKKYNKLLRKKTKKII